MSNRFVRPSAAAVSVRLRGDLDDVLAVRLDELLPLRRAEQQRRGRWPRGRAQGSPEAVRGRQRLGLAAASTSYTDGSRRVSREIVVAVEDWTVDGTPLRMLLGWARPPQEMTPLSSEGFWPSVAVRHLRELLGEVPGEFDDGRVAMLRCPIDADLRCSALSMRLVLLDDLVIWQDIRRQNYYEPYAPDQAALQPRVTFERGSYESLVRRTLARYAP